jgi:phage shock protein PspC (stress-responsive transcriptional regulator)
MTSTPSPESAATYVNSEPQPQQLPQPAAPVGRPPLRRSTTDRMAGGVCGGLAEHTGVDSLIWRVGFIALTFAGGAGILVYLLLWVLMPAGPRAADQQPGPLDRLAEQAHDKIYATGWIPPRP